MLTGSKIGDSLPGPDSLALARTEIKYDVSVHKSVCVCLRAQGCCGSGGSNNNIANSNGGPQELQMSENLIYYSREEGEDRNSPQSMNELWTKAKRFRVFSWQ